MGIQTITSVEKPGWYPNGGGVIETTVTPLEGGLSPLALNDRGELTAIDVYITTSGSENWESGISQLLIDETNTFLSMFNCGINFHYSKSCGPKASSLLVLFQTSTEVILSGKSIGGYKQKGEYITEKDRHTTINMVRNSCNSVMKDFAAGVCLDEHLQDQVIIFCALAKGTSKLLMGELSLHTTTAIAVISQMTDAIFTINDTEGLNMVTIKGIGHRV